MSIIGISKVIIAVLVLLGSTLSLLSAFGLLRLPDVYTRSHATTKSAALGVLCVLLATFIFLLVMHNHVSIKILLGILFVFLTTPTAGHLISRSAYNTNIGVVTDPYDEDAIKISRENGPKF